MLEDGSTYSETEEKLIAIWKEVLNTTTVTREDNFVDLGGDSLSAMLCISRVHSVFGIDFGIEEFFWDQATISEFAKIIDNWRP